MAGKIILQIGLHKTATTSLQDFLFANAATFARNGVRYIPLQRMRTDITPLMLTVEKNRRAKLTEFIDAVDQETLLLSDENIIGNPGEIAHGALYPFARNRIELFCEENPEKRVFIFLTLRDPVRFLLSMHSEYLRHNEHLTFDDYVGGIGVPGFSYRRTFGWLRKLPPNARVHILPFEKEHGGGVVPIARAIVEEACGISSGIDPETFPITRSRSVYSAEELDLAAEISRRADPRVAQFFLTMLDRRDKRFGHTPFDPLEPGLVEALSRRYAEDLAWFRGALPS